MAGPSQVPETHCSSSPPNPSPLALSLTFPHSSRLPPPHLPAPPAMAVTAGVPDFHPSTSFPNQNPLPGCPSSSFASASSASESTNDISSSPNPHSALHSLASVAPGSSSLSIIPCHPLILRFCQSTLFHLSLFCFLLRQSVGPVPNTSSIDVQMDLPDPSVSKPLPGMAHKSSSVSWSEVVQKANSGDGSLKLLPDETE